uniref:hypothetical protein n=1 Tax=Rhodoblastus sp. TaxID=1962975 RepID=UPI003F993BE0
MLQPVEIYGIALAGCRSRMPAFTIGSVSLAGLTAFDRDGLFHRWDGGGRGNMWRKSLGVLSAAILFTNGIAFGQESISAPGGGPSPAAYDWLSPAPLAWVEPNFNWSDSPIRPYLHEYTGYNSNILNLYPGVALPPGVNRGDSFVRTDVGASARPNYEAQQFFFDLDYSTTDYRHDTRFDLHNHFFDGGVNWTLNSLCTGTLVAADRTQEAPQDELVGPGVDILTTKLINETGRCHIYQDVSIIVNSNATSTRHSLITAQTLDNNTTYGQGGLQYAWSTLDNLQ